MAISSTRLINLSEFLFLGSVFIQVTDPSGNCAPAFNAQQLEECDALPLETSLLVRLDATTHDVSHRVCVIEGFASCTFDMVLLE
jgi:hypothetical protein